MSAGESCPFCGGATVGKNYAPDQACTGGPPGDGNAPPKIPATKESYLACSNCTREFVRAEEDIGIIMANLQVEARIAFRIKLYHGDGATVDSLLAEHRTGMVRKTRGHRPYVSASLAKRELIICFRRNSVRTYGSFIREGSRQKGRYYVFKELSEA